MSQKFGLTLGNLSVNEDGRGVIDDRRDRCMARQNAKGLIRAYVASFNAGDWRNLRALFADGANISIGDRTTGIDKAIRLWQELHQNMSTRLDIVDIVCEGDAAAALVIEKGRFIGPWRDLPGQHPTGASYELVAIDWFTFAGDRIARRWAARDSGSITRQVLGLRGYH
ncbi:ester cyclase [Camelimonas abortus]|uniref:Ester cyclase n=1 Tax=Camelimonas abortus TaxID=1017184 RepID=A0ABV7LGZ7_9HYPH